MDIGCGTGAFLSCLAELGYDVTGVDIAEAMIRQARKSTAKWTIDLRVGDATKGLPFPDKSFDVVISSYVIHGVSADLRRKIYREATRLARRLVVFHEYYKKRQLLTDIVEWAEGGDYFNFIREGEKEMREAFAGVSIIEIAPQTAWYICTPGV